jgi:hypothetical protein
LLFRTLKEIFSLQDCFGMYDRQGNQKNRQQSMTDTTVFCLAAAVLRPPGAVPSVLQLPVSISFTLPLVLYFTRLTA